MNMWHYHIVKLSQNRLKKQHFCLAQLKDFMDNLHMVFIEYPPLKSSFIAENLYSRLISLGNGRSWMTCRSVCTRPYTHRPCIRPYRTTKLQTWQTLQTLQTYGTIYTVRTHRPIKCWNPTDLQTPTNLQTLYKPTNTTDPRSLPYRRGTAGRDGVECSPPCTAYTDESITTSRPHLHRLSTAVWERSRKTCRDFHMCFHGSSGGFTSHML